MENQIPSDKKYCVQCGREIQPGARFCAECGTSVGSSPPPGASVDLKLDDNAITFLVYLVPILASLFVLNVTPYNRKPSLRFHAWQSLMFAAAWFGLHFVVVLVSLPLSLVGLPLVAVVSPIIHFGLMAAWVYLMVQALLGKTVRLPMLADFADQQAAKAPPS